MAWEEFTTSSHLAKQSEISGSNLLNSGPQAVSSQFSSGEILSIIVAWMVLSVAISYQNLVGSFTGTGSLDVVIAGFIATATGFILHEMGHKYFAIRRGYLAHFRLWIWGLILTIAVVTLSGGGLVFGAPGAVYIVPAAAAVYGHDSGRALVDPEEDNMIISVAGAGLNLALDIGFLLMW